MKRIICLFKGHLWSIICQPRPHLPVRQCMRCFKTQAMDYYGWRTVYGYRPKGQQEEQDAD
jgi:hypothetical protein